MAKESGVGMVLAIDDASGSARTLSDEISSCDWANPVSIQDVTGLGQAAPERLALIRDFTATFNGPAFNDASNNTHAVFKTISSAAAVARTVTITVSGQALADEMFLTDYAFSRAASGELTYSVPAMLADGTLTGWA